MSNDKSNKDKNQTAKVPKVYLKSLAKEHGEHVTTYILSMQEYDEWFENKWNFKIAQMRRKPLKQWQISILRDLNPTNFELESMKEEGRFEKWMEWFSEIRKFKIIEDK